MATSQVETVTTGADKAKLFVSVVVWAIVANIVRIATTGLILENFGFDYAANFFVDYSIYVVLLLMLAGIFLTAGFLPHQEDFE